MKGCNDTEPFVNGTIFSPTFHISRAVEGEIADGGKYLELLFYIKVKLIFSWKWKNPLNKCGNTSDVYYITISSCETDLGCGLSSEVSAIYQCMKDSKLECVDEDDHDHTDVQMEDDECEEFDEFDPYFFIKNLPELASVVPSFRPVLLPKRTRSCPPTTLVLDLDG